MMMKTAIAGLAALSMTLTAVPVQAQSHDTTTQHQDIATALFGLLVLGIAAKALTQDNDRADSYTPPVVRHTPDRIAPDRGGLRNDNRPGWSDRTDRVAPRVTVHPRALPASCIRVVDTRYGQHRIFGRNCLREKHRAFDRLPARCEVRIHGSNGVRNGFDPQCLRAEGYRTRR